MKKFKQIKQQREGLSTFTDAVHVIRWGFRVCTFIKWDFQQNVLKILSKQPLLDQNFKFCYLSFMTFLFSMSVILTISKHVFLFLPFWLTFFFFLKISSNFHSPSFFSYFCIHSACEWDFPLLFIVFFVSFFACFEERKTQFTRVKKNCSKLFTFPFFSW